MNSMTKIAAIAVGMSALVACQADDDGNEIFSAADSATEAPSADPDGNSSSIGDGATPVEVASLEDDQSAAGAEAVEGSDLTIDDINSVMIGDPVEYAADRNASADFSAAVLSDDERAAVFGAYDDFLTRADAVRLEGEAGDPALAESGLVDDRLADYEEELEADFGRIQDVVSFANAERVSGATADWVMIEDCVEVSVTTSISVVSSDFVRQDVWLEPDGDGTWTVTAVSVIHDGKVASSNEPGCVPRRYAEQAEAVTAEFIRLESAGPDVDADAVGKVTTEEFFDAAAIETPPDAFSTDGMVVTMLGHHTLAGTRTLYLEACVPDADGVSFRQYEVTRGLLNGFPDFGDDLDVYAVSDRSPAESVVTCPIGSDS